MMRPLSSLALVACLTVASVATTTVPAWAEEPAGVTPRGHATLDIAPNTTDTGFVYCITGTVDADGRVAGGWTIRVSGIRGTAPYTPADVNISSATYSNGCPTISTAATDNGYLLIDVSYVAAGGSVIAHSTGHATWTVADGYHASSYDFTP